MTATVLHCRVAQESHETPKDQNINGRDSRSSYQFSKTVKCGYGLQIDSGRSEAFTCPEFRIIHICVALKDVFNLRNGCM